MVRKKIRSYNDGVATVYKERKKRTDFNAKVNARTLADYEQIGRVFYKIETQRQEDFIFAEAMGKRLELKISVPNNLQITTDKAVHIDGFMYDIYRVDPDKINRQLYLYLTGARAI